MVVRTLAEVTVCKVWLNDLFQVVLCFLILITFSSLMIVVIEADCWMKGQCWMKISTNNIRLEVKTLISFISFHPTILVYKLKHWIHFRCFHPAIFPSNNPPLTVLIVVIAVPLSTAHQWLSMGLSRMSPTSQSAQWCSFEPKLVLDVWFCKNSNLLGAMGKFGQSMLSWNFCYCL